MDSEFVGLVPDDQVALRGLQIEHIVIFGIRELKYHKRPLHTGMSPSTETYHLKSHVLSVRHLHEVAYLTAHDVFATHLAADHGLVDDEEKFDRVGSRQ